MRFINKIISQPKSPVAKNSKINEVPDAKKSHRLFSLTFDWFLLEFINCGGSDTDFWSDILSDHAISTWFFCDTCPEGSQSPSYKKSNSPETVILHVGSLEDSLGWAQPPFPLLRNLTYQWGPLDSRNQPICQLNTTKRSQLLLWRAKPCSMSWPPGSVRHNKMLLLDATKFGSSLLCINSNNFRTSLVAQW